MKKRIIVAAGLLLAAAVLYLALPQTSPFFKKKPIVVAVAGPFSGPLRPEGLAMYQGALLAADEINRNGGIGGRSVRLRRYDDRNQPREATRTAAEIAASNDILLVLGHYDGPAALMAGRTYRKNGIPAITGSAALEQVTENNEWYFRTSANNRFQGSFIATYATRSMNKKAATIIHVDDFYGRGLAKSFEKVAKRARMEINERKWAISADAREQRTDIERMAAGVRSVADPGIVLVAAQGDVAVEIIAALKASGARYDIIGGTAFSAPDFARSFRRYPKEKAMPGYYTNGIYALTPFQPEMAGELGRTFENAYMKRFAEAPSWVAAVYYDAMKTAGEAIALIDIGDSDAIRRHRNDVRAALESIHLPEIGVKGLGGMIYFDNNGDFNGALTVGRYADNRFSPSFIQYQHMEGRQTAAGDLGRVLKGEIILVEDKPMIKTQLVFTGIEVHRIKDLAPLNSTFSADFSLWFRYRGDVDPAAIRFTNAVKPIPMGPPLSPTSQDSEEGVLFHSYSIQSGLFRARFDFRDYPFDRQSLAIRFRHERLTRDQLIYAPDRFQPEKPVRDAVVGLTQLNAATGWAAVGSRVFQKSVGDEESLSIPELLPGGTAPAYSEFNFRADIRKRGGQVVKHFFPLIILTVMAYAVFFTPASAHVVRIALGSAVILSIAVYHAAHLARLPVAYVTTLEYAIYGAYFLAGAAVFLSFFMLKSDQCGEGLTAGRVRRAGLIGYPVAAGVLTALILGRHLWG